MKTCADTGPKCTSTIIGDGRSTNASRGGASGGYAIDFTPPDVGVYSASVSSESAQMSHGAADTVTFDVVEAAR